MNILLVLLPIICTLIGIGIGILMSILFLSARWPCGHNGDICRPNKQTTPQPLFQGFAILPSIPYTPPPCRGQTDYPTCTLRKNHQEELSYDGTPCSSPRRDPSPTRRLITLHMSQTLNRLQSSSKYTLTRLGDNTSLPMRGSPTVSMNTHDEIHVDEVDVIDKIGGGAFGVVYKGEWRGAMVAIKAIRVSTTMSGSLGAAVREVIFSKKLTHPNVVQTFSWTLLTQPPSFISLERSSKLTNASKMNTNGLRRAGADDDNDDDDGGDGDWKSPNATMTTIPAVWWNTTPHTYNRDRRYSLSSTPIKSIRATDIITTPGKTQNNRSTDANNSANSIDSSYHKRMTKHNRCSMSSSKGTSPQTSSTVGVACHRVDSFTSFNSEEGFGSPIKKKYGGVQSLFTLESITLENTEALLVVVMEYCDLGTLERAIQRRAFLPSSKWPRHTTFRALLRTAAEIAKAMDYIHSQGITHGDLKPNNIFLKTHRADRRGYVAKIGDFGLSTFNNSSSTMNHQDNDGGGGDDTCSRWYGTVHYAPPEAFEGQSAGQAGDVYAFGIILWQMLYCQTPYKGMMEAQIYAGVMDGWLRPRFESEPTSRHDQAVFKSLVKRCWAQHPDDRPTFYQVWKELVDIEMNFRNSLLKRAPSFADDTSTL